MTTKIEQINTGNISAGNDIEPINNQDMVIDMRSILYDNQTARHKFLYVPGSGKGFIKQVKRLLEDVMIIFDDRDKNSVTELYEIYSRLLTDNFSPEMLKELVIQKENPSVHRGGSSSEELYIQGKPSEDVQRYNEKFIMPYPGLSSRYPSCSTSFTNFIKGSRNAGKVRSVLQ